MKSELIYNPHRTVAYYDAASGMLRREIWELLTLNKLRVANYKAHESNISNFIVRPDKHISVLNGIVAIPPRSIWLRDGIKWSVFPSAGSSPKKTGLDEINQIVKRLLRVVGKKEMAIELSGGLDTSIIIGLLKSLAMSPLLVGFTSDKFEFRTEKYIQDLYAGNTDAVLLPQTKCLPFSGLRSCPSHQLPSSTSIFYTHALTIADFCASKKIRLLLSGMGFDGLLCDSIPYQLTGRNVELWSPWTMDDNWFNEYVYSPKNIAYKSGAASRCLMRRLVALRAGENEDVQKRMARKLFENYLPVELVRYAYKSDSCTAFIEGFFENEKTVREIFGEARRITGSVEFKNDVIDVFLQNIQKNEDTTTKSILAKVSCATWLYCLSRDGKIT